MSLMYKNKTKNKQQTNKNVQAGPPLTNLFGSAHVETVLLSTNNICFGREFKINFIPFKPAMDSKITEHGVACSLIVYYWS